MLRTLRPVAHRRSLTMMALATASALVLTACGSKSGSSSTTTSSDSTSSSSSVASSSSEMSTPSSTDSSMSSASSAMSSDTSAMMSPTSAMSDTSGMSSMAGSMTSGMSSMTGSAMSGTPSGGSAFPAMTGTPANVKLGMAYDGPKGDHSFTDSAARGAAAVVSAGGTLTAELAATVGEADSAKENRLQQLVDQGANTVVAVGYDYGDALTKVAKANPNVHFAIVDSVVDVPNVASLTFAAQESSFLVGAAAALKSKTGHVAFIGGVNVPLIQAFEAGFDAGAKAANPSIKIDDKYITQAGDNSGYSSPDKAQTIAKGLYDAGADVIYPAAGGSGTGVFKEAKADGKLAIGVDSDQYQDATLADYKSVIITSAVKNVDVATYLFASSVAAGKAETGVQTFDLKSGGVGYTTTGGAIDAIVPQLEKFKSEIVAGTIKVPSTLS